MTNDPKWRQRLKKRDPKKVSELNKRYNNSEAGREARKRKYKKTQAHIEGHMALRGNKCLDCGYKDDLVWHHRNPKEKKFTISYARTYRMLDIEIAKCDLLCPNCHARRHREMREQCHT